MKKFFYLFTFLLSFTTATYAYAQETNDSLNFEEQRARVNQLLQQRSQRFGEFDVSLQQKTGIFGIFKTKADMQKSIDILKQIVLTDNNIFLETKRLLEIKDYESHRHQALALEYDKQVSAYMKTITKLQDENERLRNQIGQLDEQEHDSNIYVYLLIIGILALLFVIYRLYKQNQTRKFDETLISPHK
ncbi:hypothetical protein [Sphingobacterium sp. LRF_L2]|uniref:hypothetical protein n=1 Tax=Sphingobacterium sp. LRF_L2 TaxID=3369421 RepID=UPI003F647C1C